jgi:outer membrane protein TolC
MQSRFDKEMLSLMNSEEKVLKEFTNRGIYKQTDYLSFQIGLQQFEFTQQQTIKQYRANLSALNYLCGIDDTSFVEISIPELPIENIPEFSGSAFNEQFILDSLMLRNAHEKIDFQYKPKVNLFADGGYNSSLDYLPYKNFGVNAGISVSAPLYDGGQRKLEHEKLTIDEQSRQKYHNFYTSQYKQQINSAKQQLSANNQLSDQLKKQLIYIETLLHTYHTLLETGDVSITEYLLTLGNYMNAKNQLLVNDLERYQIINELNYWNQSK